MGHLVSISALNYLSDTKPSAQVLNRPVSCVHVSIQNLGLNFCIIKSHYPTLWQLRLVAMVTLDTAFSYGAVPVAMVTLVIALQVCSLAVHYKWLGVESKNCIK